MRIERLPVSRLNPAPYNPRKDLEPGDPEYEKIRRSVERWGLVEPLVWNRRTGHLVGGHQRLKVLMAQGAREADVSVVDLDAQEEAALNVALNKTDGDWDFGKLSELLSELDAHGFDATLTGFDGSELEQMLTWTPSDSAADAGGVASADATQWLCVVTCPGEHALAALYERLTAEGYACKLVT